MNKYANLIVTGVVMFALQPYSSAEPSSPTGPQVKVHSVHGYSIDQLIAKLDLTPTQVERIRKLGEAQHQVLANTPQEHRKQATLNMGGSFLDILTPSQRERYYDMILSSRLREYIRTKNSNK